jgi:CelD/BcsL family acetyltransferase involved in cellulose biosynthesis
MPGPALSLGLTQLDPLLVTRPPQQARVDTLDYIDTAWVDVEGTFDAYWEARGKNLRHNIRKQRSKLQEQGITLRLETVTQPADVAHALLDYGTLESAGWKAEQGTAIHPDNAQGRFYREMLEAYCAAGQGRIYRLWFGDRVVAVDLCIKSEEALVILKTTYDETQQGYSPAFLMRHAAFGELFTRGEVRRIEFYGKLMDWHKRWTDHWRTLYHVNYYRWNWLQEANQALARLRARGAQPAAITKA